MSVASKARGSVAALQALTHFATHPREMVHFATHRREMMDVYHEYPEKFVYEFPVVDFRELLEPGQRRSSLQLDFEPDLYGDVSWQELVVLSSLVAHYKPKRLFEIGTFMGKTTMHLAANSPPDAKVYTLDLPQENFEEIKKNLATYDESLLVDGRKPVGFHYRRSPWANKIEQLFANSMSFDESKYAEQMDFVFVDADHYYPSVVNDTRKAMAMLSRKPGSMVLWHDLGPKTDVERGIIDVVGKQGVFKIKNTKLGICRV
jgi:hypothetical protein